MRVKCLGGRELRGALRGYDELVNLVLDDCEEFIRGEYIYCFFIRLIVVFSSVFVYLLSACNDFYEQRKYISLLLYITTQQPLWTMQPTQLINTSTFNE